MTQQDTQHDNQTERDGLDFASLAATHRKTAFNSDMTSALDELVKAVRETGKKGHITLKLSVAPLDPDGITLALKDQITENPPKPDTGTTPYFATDQGALTRDHPHQTSMFGDNQ